MSAFRDHAAKRTGARALAGLLAAAAGVTLLAVPAVALAAEASVNKSSGLLLYASGDGEINSVVVRRETRAGGPFFVIAESGTAAGAPIVVAPTPPECRLDSAPGQVACSADGVTTIRLNLGDGDDSALLDAATSSRLEGGVGNDALTGGSGFDVMLGESGDDNLQGGPGADRLDGGEGADTLDGGPGADRISCGSDTVMDTVIADPSDTVTNCEADTVVVTATQAPPQPPPPALAPAPQPPPTAVVTESIAVLNPFPIVRMRGSVTSSGARISLLSVRSPRGARVEVRCKGRSCPRARMAATSRSRSLRFRALQRHFAAGVVLEIRVTKPAMIGKYVRFTIRKGKSPLRRDMCLLPGSRAPVRCDSV